MQHRPLVTLAAGAVLLLAACSSGGTTTATPATAASAAPSVAESPAAAGGAPCAESSATGEVSAEIKNFAFNPAAIAAKVGQTVTFTNNDSIAHTASLDDGSCTTPNIPGGGGKDGLMFTAAGTYPFHCNVHPTMKGTITVS